MDKKEDFSVFSKNRANVSIIDQNYFQTQADTFYLKSEMAYYAGQPVQAIDYLKEAILQAPHSLHLRSRLGDIYRGEKLLAEAAKQYQLLIEQTNFKEFHYKLAEIYFLRGLNQEALKNYKNLKSPAFSVAFQEARLFIDEKAWPLALRSLNQAGGYAVTKTEKTHALLAKAFIYKHLHQQSKQEEIFKQILQIDISEEDLLLKATQFYLASQKLKEAEILLLQYQNKDGTSVAITKSLFSLYLSLNSSNEAHKQLLRLKQLGNLEDVHYFFLVSFLLSKNKYSEAIPFIKDLVQKFPLTDYYRYLLGATYEQNKEWKQSLSSYKQIQKKSPYFVSAQIQQGQIWKDRGQLKKAIRLLEQVAFSPESAYEPKPLLLYAQYLWAEGKKDLSISSLTKGLILFPKNTDILFLRGLYLGKSGKTDLSLKDMEKILELNSSHAEALNFMAYTYAEKKQNLDRAEALSYRSLSLQPSSSYFLDTLGWIFFQKGAYKQALVHLTKAFSGNKKDVSIAEHLAETHYKLKNFEKCEHFFKQAFKLETNEKKRLQIKKRRASLQLYP